MTAAARIDQDGPWRAAGAPAARARLAATLILVRGGPVQPQILMGRRSAGHDFMPHKWVFPGGRVDAADHYAIASRELSGETRSALEAGLRPRRRPSLPRALALAAVRETFEEAGLLLASPHPAPEGARGPWGRFYALNVAPDLEPLRYLGRAVTPSDRPKRYDACFFLAPADRLLSQTPASISGELDEIGWFAPHDLDRLDLPEITRRVVAEVRLSWSDPGRRPFALLAGRRRSP
jgi:8-oxo-dGTP pyrophosphatase MutT (NUDIX family)